MKKLWHYVRKTNTAFLFGTFLTTVTAVPAYIWHYGLSGFQVALFLFFTVSTAMSITLGYHRLFSHLTFKAQWPVKLYTLLFGAAAFEGSALEWSADHRRHHKFVDHDEDPYDISKGLFHAHIGWLLFRTGPETPLTWVRDLQNDRLASWQHRYYVPIAIGWGFALPALLGGLWGGAAGALGGFLIAGTARIVVVHHMTFCINSLCHWIGDRPYSTHCTARNSVIMALCTFGEGYHNFHHEFQYDYRNGIKPWQWDPTKWAIWTLSKIGLVSNLRTIPEEKIVKAQILEHERKIAATLKIRSVSEAVSAALDSARARTETALADWEVLLREYRTAASRQTEVSRAELRTLKGKAEEAYGQLRSSFRHWIAAYHDIRSGSPTA